MLEQSFQVIVIGAGPGGYAAAFRAADEGLNVALVDAAENPGGVCLYRGCIPTKTLLHISKLKQEIAEAKNWGLNYSEPEWDLGKIRNWKNKVVAQLTGGLGQLTKRRKVTYIQGFAQFTGSNHLQIKESKETIHFDHAIIATGSSPVILPGMTLSNRVMDSSEALELKDIPESLLVIGAGYIGMEMGTIYATLGTKVTIVELSENIMAGMDRDLVNVYLKQNKKLFDDILTKTKVAELSENDNNVKVILENEDGGKVERTFSKTLISVGRKPNTSGIGLENTKVETDAQGFIKTDIQLRTSDTSIFAIGDVIGNPMLAHKANHEAIVVAEVIAGHKRAFEPKTIPSVVYTNPEIATCGLSEADAKQKGFEVKTTKFPWAANGRALTMGATNGLTKLIFDAKNERILGAGIAGSHAGELIGELALAVEMSATASDIALTVHPHPTISETIMEAAELFYGQCTDLYHPKRK